MRNAVLAMIRAALIVCFAAPAAGQDGNIDNELERVQDALAQITEGNATNAAVYDTNGFHVEAAELEELGVTLKPNATRFQQLWITADDVFKVGVEKGRPMSTGGGVGIFHRKEGTPMVSIADRNGDGLVDILTYAVLDENGEVVLDVVDYEADGQADMRVNFKDRYFELWHIDRWYRTEVRDGHRGIVVDGEFMELQRADNRWIVP